MPHPIVTLTLNPAVDIASQANGVRPDHKTRTVGERIDPGGGGINVANIIHILGGDAIAVLLSGGVTGRYLEELLDERGVPWRAVPIAGRVRLCTIVHDRLSGSEYRFVPEGPLVAEAEWQATLQTLQAMKWQWLIASGSLPRGVPADFYRHVAELAAARGGNFVLDTSGPALKASLGPAVTLVKPSLAELEYLCGRPLPTRADQIAAATGLVRSGATSMVALTLGGEGALLATAEGAVFMPALKVPVRSTVGAGDGFLAAMVLELARGGKPEAALRWGIATGSAVAGTDGTAHVHADAVTVLFARTDGTAEHLQLAAA